MYSEKIIFIDEHLIPGIDLVIIKLNVTVKLMP